MKKSKRSMKRSLKFNLKKEKTERKHKKSERTLENIKTIRFARQKVTFY